MWEDVKATVNSVGYFMKIDVQKNRAGCGSCNIHDGLKGCGLCGWGLDPTFKVLFTDEFVFNGVTNSVSATGTLVSCMNKL
jgi:hypothetical protein